MRVYRFVEDSEGVMLERVTPRNGVMVEALAGWETGPQETETDKTLDIAGLTREKTK